MLFTETKNLKVAIIGGGINSAVGLAHISSLNLSGRYTICAACFSRDPSVNKLSATKYNISYNNLYNSFEELVTIEAKNIDIIILLTPTNQHYSQVRHCLKNEIPVICEKSLTTNLSDALELRDILKDKKGFLKVIYNYLGYPMLRELKNQIIQKKIGKVLHVQIEMPNEGFLRYLNGSPVRPQDWRLKDESVPTLALDLGVHLHMIMKYVTGEIPLRIVSLNNSFGNFKDIIDNSISIIEYTNDVICNMWYSKVSLGQRNGLRIRIYGSLGSAEWYQEEAELLKFANNTGHKWTIDRGGDDVMVANQSRYTRFKVGHPAGFIEALANYYEDIWEELSSFISQKPFGQEQESYGINEAVEGMYFLEAMTNSSLSQSWINICNPTNGIN